MNKSMSVMKNASAICGELRKKYFGESASARDYKDSFVINNAIESFCSKPEVLMLKEITEKDKEMLKVSKTVNFRANCYEKIQTLSRLLAIPESEVCRRILYYSLMNHENKSGAKNEISILSKIAILQTQIEASLHTINEIVSELRSEQEE